MSVTVLLRERECAIFSNSGKIVCTYSESLGELKEKVSQLRAACLIEELSSRRQKGISLKITLTPETNLDRLASVFYAQFGIEKVRMKGFLEELLPRDTTPTSALSELPGLFRTVQINISTERIIISDDTSDVLYDQTVTDEIIPSKIYEMHFHSNFGNVSSTVDAHGNLIINLTYGAGEREAFRNCLRDGLGVDPSHLEYLTAFDGLECHTERHSEGSVCTDSSEIEWSDAPAFIVEPLSIPQLVNDLVNVLTTRNLRPIAGALTNSCAFSVMDADLFIDGAEVSRLEQFCFTIGYILVSQMMLIGLARGDSCKDILSRIKRLMQHVGRALATEGGQEILNELGGPFSYAGIATVFHKIKDEYKSHLSGGAGGELHRLPISEALREMWDEHHAASLGQMRK